MCKRITFGKWFALGALSSYPTCCIVWGWIRAKLWVDIIGEETALTVMRHKVWGKSRNTQHVMCPIHLPIAMIFGRYNYYQCKKCGWHQYRTRKCNVCEMFVRK